MPVLRPVRSAALVALATFVWSPAAQAPAEAAGAPSTLGPGGVATGDISLRAGDEDVVTVDLVEGCTVSAKFAAAFAADVAFTGPDGSPLDLGWGTGPKRSANAFAVRATGRHTFRIRATGATQGRYTLTVVPKWPRRVSLSGTSGGSVSWSMPAGATVSGKVAAFPARSWDPRVETVTGSGGGNLLPAPVQGAKGTAVLPPLTSGSDGVCDMTVTGGTPGGAFRASLALKVPKAPPVRADLSDGLTVLSFEADGVRSLLAAKCASCHVWTGSATAFRPFAKSSLARVESGQMPQGGPPLPSSETALLRQWIATGMKP